MNHRKLGEITSAIVLASLLMVAGCHKKVPLPSSPPVASLTASTHTIHRGQSATLTWSTQNATDVNIDPIGNVAASGSEIVNPVQTVTYRLTALGPGGTAHASVQITVTEPTGTVTRGS